MNWVKFKDSAESSMHIWRIKYNNFVVEVYAVSGITKGEEFVEDIFTFEVYNHEKQMYYHHTEMYLTLEETQNAAINWVVSYVENN